VRRDVSWSMRVAGDSRSMSWSSGSLGRSWQGSRDCCGCFCACRLGSVSWIVSWRVLYLVRHE